MKRIIAFLLILAMALSIMPLTVFAAKTVKVSGVKTMSKLYLVKGKKATLPWVVSPVNATNKGITWVSENKKIATVNNKGVVKGVKAGKTAVTVTTKNGKKKARCTVYVVKKTVKVKKVSIIKGSSSGNTLRLNAKITPAKATGAVVKWKSSNTKIATVDKLGKVTKKNAGKATISATVGGKKAKLAVTVSPTPTPTPTPVPLPQMSIDDYPKIDGSTANIPLAVMLMQKVTGCTKAEAENAVQFSTTDQSYYALGRGDADMLLVYEAAKDTKKSVSGYSTFKITPIGRDALVFLVNKANPVKSLTTEQIRDIFSNEDGSFHGKTRNWMDVGGDNLEIMPLQRQADSGSYTMMDKLIMKGREICGAVIYNMLNMLKAVNDDPSAIGFSVYYYVDIMIEMPNIKLLAIDGIVPSYNTIKSGLYPHVNDFYCVLPKNPTANAKLISYWLLSDEGQRFVADCGYVPVR